VDNWQKVEPVICVGVCSGLRRSLAEALAAVNGGRQNKKQNLRRD
jgi:hypothetical protein